MQTEAESKQSAQADASEPEPIQWWLHALLFFTTCGTTFFAGSISSPNPPDFFAGFLFSASIMGILLVHEMGHFLAARHHQVSATLPYFIPMPLPPVGTFGAVIRMRQPPRTRQALLDIGAAGPLAGLVVAVAVCYAGLCLSEVKPIVDMGKGSIMEGNSILYLLLKKLAHPELGPYTDVWLHPMAWAGWLGLLVTSLNLLPAGQLDGGHVLYALMGQRLHQKVARLVHVLVFLMGMIGLGCQLILLSGPMVLWLQQTGWIHLVLRGSGMLMWLVWAVLLRFVGGAHPPVGSDEAPLSPARRRLGWAALLVLVLTFTPSVWSPTQP